MDVWITLDAVDWFGEQVQSGLALAQVWHLSSSEGEQVHSGLALAQVWHLSSPVILIVWARLWYRVTVRQIKTP
jgi:hypothetical protein